MPFWQSLFLYLSLKVHRFPLFQKNGQDWLKNRLIRDFWPHTHAMHCNADQTHLFHSHTWYYHNGAGVKKWQISGVFTVYICCENPHLAKPKTSGADVVVESIFLEDFCSRNSHSKIAEFPCNLHDAKIFSTIWKWGVMSVGHLIECQDKDLAEGSDGILDSLTRTLIVIQTDLSMATVQKLQKTRCNYCFIDCSSQRGLDTRYR